MWAVGTHYAMDESGTSCAEHGEGLLSLDREGVQEA